MSNIDEVNQRIEELRHNYNSNWGIYYLMVILVRLTAKILDRLEKMNNDD